MKDIDSGTYTLTFIVMYKKIYAIAIFHSVLRKFNYFLCYQLECNVFFFVEITTFSFAIVFRRKFAYPQQYQQDFTTDECYYIRIHNSYSEWNIQFYLFFQCYQKYFGYRLLKNTILYARFHTKQWTIQRPQIIKSVWCVCVYFHILWEQTMELLDVCVYTNISVWGFFLRLFSLCLITMVLRS